MSHWTVLPIVLPALAAALLVLLPRRIAVQRAAGITATLAVLAVSLVLFHEASDGAYHAYRLGDWAAPFGILLVLDRLSALMLVLTAAIATASIVYAANGLDSRGPSFHPLFQFQLMGLNGAFLTGDIFNLFVFFEVLLIASYGLLLHTGGRERLRAGVHYVVINLTGSLLFLIAVSLLYAMTGTLNMADLARAVAAADADNAPLIRSAGLLLIVVFAIKAAVVPLNFWLPATYASATAPVAALFAIMTKLGIYAILRVSTLLFGPEAGVGTDLALPWLLPAGLATLVVATCATLAARTLATLVAYCTIASVGTLLVALGAFDRAAVGAALYYLAHSTLAVAAAFLLTDLIARRRGAAGGLLRAATPLARPLWLGAAFFAAALALAGLPPLSGFLGKLLVLQATYDSAAQAWVWSVLLVNALLTLIAFARAGSLVFWKPAHGDEETVPPAPVTALEAAPLCVLLGCLVALSIAAAPATRFANAASEQILDPGGYIEAILGNR